MLREIVLAPSDGLESLRGDSADRGRLRRDLSSHPAGANFTLEHQPRARRAFRKRVAVHGLTREVPARQSVVRPKSPTSSWTFIGDSPRLRTTPISTSVSSTPSSIACQASAARRSHVDTLMLAFAAIPPVPNPPDALVQAFGLDNSERNQARRPGRLAAAAVSRLYFWRRHAHRPRWSTVAEARAACVAGCQFATGGGVSFAARRRAGAAAHREFVKDARPDSLWLRYLQRPAALRCGACRTHRPYPFWIA